MPYVAIFVALVIGAAGHMILRPSVVILGFCVGSMSTLHIFYQYAGLLHNWNCESVVVASFSLGGVLGLIGATLVSAVSVLLGCFAGGSFCTLLFDICLSCNGAPWTNAPVLLGKTLVPFWLTFGVLSGIGGFVCKRQDKRVLVFVTSVIGGWGTAVGVRLAVGARGMTLPSWAGLLIACCIAALGYATQTRTLQRSERAKTVTVVARTEGVEGLSL